MNESFEWSARCKKNLEFPVVLTLLNDDDPKRSMAQHFKAATLHFLNAEGLFRLSCLPPELRVLCLNRYRSR